MKKSNMLTMAALTCGFAMMFTSCSKEDNGTQPALTVISFEHQTLNADGYWCGNETGTPFDNWGSTAYNCLYTEAEATFPVNYTPAWGSWSGYAISNINDTTFESYNVGQFKNVTGSAHSGKNFCVVYSFGEAILFDKASTVRGFYFTNDAYTANAILNGDGLTPGKFESTDWLKCIVTGTREDGTTANVEIYLAKDGQYVKDWQWADLSVLGKVKSLSFAFDGTKKNDWGLTTPTYICIDDLTLE